jgi:hypothetical protein
MNNISEKKDSGQGRKTSEQYHHFIRSNRGFWAEITVQHTNVPFVRQNRPAGHLQPYLN